LILDFPLLRGRHGWRRGLAAGLALVLAVVVLAARAADIPPLTGRIVDNASLLDAASAAALDAKLADLETKSGIQLVVATVPALGGEEIEPYANRLFRAWKLGEKTRNNGVLLLIAPTERRVRIEVGYGLEATLTDALSQVIVSNAITPRFKAGDFAGGIGRGVDDIITVLTTDASEWHKRPSLRFDSSPGHDRVNWFAMGGIALFLLLLMVSRTFRWLVFAMLLSGSNSGGGYGGHRGGWGGGFGGSRPGGGFGGGGSSGGGGATGRW
jgi:uncharacterized protein